MDESSLAGDALDPCPLLPRLAERAALAPGTGNSLFPSLWANQTISVSVSRALRRTRPTRPVTAVVQTAIVHSLTCMIALLRRGNFCVTSCCGGAPDARLQAAVEEGSTLVPPRNGLPQPFTFLNYLTVSTPDGTGLRARPHIDSVPNLRQRLLASKNGRKTGKCGGEKSQERQ